MERDADASRDRMVSLGTALVGNTTESDIAAIRDEVDAVVLAATDEKEFGSTCADNSPRTETNIIDRVIEMAVRPFKPIVEIQFFDNNRPADMGAAERARGEALAVERQLVGSACR